MSSTLTDSCPDKNQTYYQNFEDSFQDSQELHMPFVASPSEKANESYTDKRLRPDLLENTITRPGILFNGHISHDKCCNIYANDEIVTSDSDEAKQYR